MAAARLARPDAHASTAAACTWFGRAQVADLEELGANPHVGCAGESLWTQKSTLKNFEVGRRCFQPSGLAVVEWSSG